MTWWNSTHRVGLVLVVSTLLTLCSIFLGSFAVLLPAASGDNPFGAVPFFAIIPLLTTATLSAFLEGAEQRPYALSVRRVYLMDWALGLSVIGAAAVLCGVALVAFPGVGAPMETIRNTIGFCGIQLCASRWLHYRYQSIVPALFVFAAGVFGRLDGAQGGIAEWAWPIAAYTVDGLWVPVAFFVVGSALTVTGVSHRGVIRGS